MITTILLCVCSAFVAFAIGLNVGVKVERDKYKD